FGRRRLCDHFAGTVSAPLEETLQSLLALVGAHLAGADFEDDFTVIGIERTNTGPGHHSGGHLMETLRERHIVREIPRPGVRVIRFVCPDLREPIDDAESISECTLYRELQAAALADLSEGETMVLNFGLIDWFTSAFYRLLLKVREAVQARKAHLVL